MREEKARDRKVAPVIYRRCSMCAGRIPRESWETHMLLAHRPTEKQSTEINGQGR